MHFLIWLSCIAGLTAAANLHYRLPTSIVPQKYKLQVLTRLDEQRFEGVVTITLRALQNTKNITLHALELDIDESKIVLKQVGSYKHICIRSTEVHEAHEFYIMHLCEELQAHTSYDLTMSFEAPFKKQLLGYFALSYQDTPTNTSRWLTATQFQPTEARKAFPCFDEPALKARFTITLGHDKRYRALSNMPLKSKRINFELQDYMWSDFVESVPMSSYLVAYTLNEYAHVSSVSSRRHRIVFNSWARPDVIEQCNFAASFGPAVLEYYENLFRIPFPLAKIDQLAIENFDAGAMENWGLVIYREGAILVDNNNSRVLNKYIVATFIAHELAHQWFGNLVTMKWWTDLWLNEGFATFLSSVTVERLQPDWSSVDLEALLNYLVIFASDSLENSHAVVREMETRTDMHEAFDIISYKKGSIVVRMIYLILGERTFWNGLIEYLHKYSYGSAEQDDLWTMLTKAAHRDGVLPRSMTVKSVMDSWTLQVGYPLVSVVRDYRANTVRITQARYLKDRVERERLRGKQNCWWVPLSYTTASELEFKRTTPQSWLSCTNDGQALAKTIELKGNPDDWILLNVQMSALYKINYDERNWQLLIETLKHGDFEQIHVLNRAQLIDDALTLAWSGDLSYELALRLLTYLCREREYLPWLVATQHLDRIEVFLSRSAHYDVYKKFMRKLLTPVYEHLNGLNDTFGTLRSNIKIVHKELIANWACRFQVGDCASKAREYFGEWRQALATNPKANNPVPINLGHVVYCTAVENGNSDDWNFAWSQYVHTNNAVEKELLLDALACTRESWLLHLLLERAFHGLQSVEAAKAVMSLSISETGYKMTTDYIMENMETLLEFFHPYVKDEEYFSALMEQVTTSKELLRFKELFGQHKALQGDVFKKMLRTRELYLQWHEQHFETFWKTIENLEKTECVPCYGN